MPVDLVVISPDYGQAQQRNDPGPPAAGSSWPVGRKYRKCRDGSIRPSSLVASTERPTTSHGTGLAWPRRRRA